MTWRFLVRSNRSGLLGPLATAVLVAAASGAGAATTNTSLLVSVVVEPVCTVSAYPLSFGSYTPGLGGVSGNTTLSVRCTRGAPFTVALDAGSGGGSVAQRQMTFGAHKLRYNLYTSAARTTVWGDGTSGSAVVGGIGKGLTSDGTITETMYGQLPDSSVNQNLAPGLYTDIIRVTVTY
jgi:spore coat protein U-like protein